MQIHRWSSFMTLSMLIFSSNLFAQQVVPAAGGTSSGSSGSVSYTVGSVVYGTYSGTSGAISEGVQQPYEIVMITGLNDLAGVILNISAFPNPVSDYLTINAEEMMHKPISFQFYNTNGILLREGWIVGKQTVISLEDLQPSTYILNIIDEEKPIQSYKIIKR